MGTVVKGKIRKGATLRSRHETDGRGFISLEAKAVKRMGYVDGDRFACQLMKGVNNDMWCVFTEYDERGKKTNVNKLRREKNHYVLEVQNWKFDPFPATPRNIDILENGFRFLLPSDLKSGKIRVGTGVTETIPDMPKPKPPSKDKTVVYDVCSLFEAYHQMRRSGDSHQRAMKQIDQLAQRL